MKITDLKGLTRLISDATIGISDLVQSMQQEIVHPPFLPSTPIQQLISGISSIPYKGVKLGTKLVTGSLDKALGVLQPILGEGTSSEQREKVLASLNGIIGDYLEKTDNPLALTMDFRHQHQIISLNKEHLKTDFPKITGKILVMVHGLCMSDRRWRNKDHDHGAALTADGDWTPVYVQYNSGRHISTNGQNLNELFEQLVENWPVPVESVHFVSYSMGGLVSRSAIHYGFQEKKTWTRRLQKIVFLGTPHHGASLERIGNYIDLALKFTPYLKPFARLGKIRSAGITDLRYGNLIEADWQGIDRFELRPDARKPIPLPEGVDCYNIAATKSKHNDDLQARKAGDGLVSLNSALGRHKNPDKKLAFNTDHHRVIYGSTHTDLLNEEEVLETMKGWGLGSS